MQDEIKSIILHAATSGNCNMLLALCGDERGAGRHDPYCCMHTSNHKDHLNGLNPLHLAALHGHAAAVALLIDRCGADVSSIVDSGATPAGPLDDFSALHIAALYGCTAAVLELVDAGASLDMLVQPGLHALALALHHGHKDTAAALLRHTPPPNGAFMGPAANPALCSGGAHGRIKALPQHVRSSRLWELAVQDQEGRDGRLRMQREGQWQLCAQAAVQRNWHDILGLLIYHAGGTGAVTGATDPVAGAAGAGLLQTAVLAESWGAMCTLLRQGATFEGCAEEAHGALMHAVATSDVGLARQLLGAGASAAGPCGRLLLTAAAARDAPGAGPGRGPAGRWRARRQRNLGQARC